MIFFFFNELVMSEVSAADVNLAAFSTHLATVSVGKQSLVGVMIKEKVTNWGWTDMDKPNL